MTRSIGIHIDELILHGFQPGDRDQIAGALQRELVRLIDERGVPASLLQEESARGFAGGTPEISTAPGKTPSGEQIALALYEGWQH